MEDACQNDKRGVWPSHAPCPAARLHGQPDCTGSQTARAALLLYNGEMKGTVSCNTEFCGVVDPLMLSILDVH